MNCTCRKNRTISTPTTCDRCNSCRDTGCLKFISPRCILTEVAYSCLGVAAGKTLTEFLAAVEELCANLPNTQVIEGCSQTFNGSEVETIEVTPTATGYQICVGEELLTAINDRIVDLEDCCENNSNDIIAIQQDIVTINEDITNIFDSITPETWKLIGAGGTMANGQAVPSFPAGVANFGGGAEPLRLRALPNNYVELSGTLIIAGMDNTTPQPVLLVTLPTGYRPGYTLSIPTVAGIGVVPAATNLNILTNGSVLVVISGLSGTPADVGVPVHAVFSLD